MDNNTILIQAINDSFEEELDREISELGNEEHEYPKGFEKRLNKLLRSGRSIRPHKKTAALIAVAAAAAVMTVSAGAVVYRAVTHSDTLAEYGVQEVPTETAAFLPQTVENAHLRWTVDSMFSDGLTAYFFYTIEPLDDTGRSFLDGTRSDGSGPMVRRSQDIKDLDTLARFHNMRGGGIFGENGIYTMNSTLDIDRLEDPTKPLYLKLMNIADPEDEVCSGLVTAISSVSRNVRIRVMTDGDGHEITVSPVGLSSHDPELSAEGYELFMNDARSFIDDSRLCFTDGTEKPLFDWEDNENAQIHPDEKHVTAFFAANVDIEGIETVELFGHKFR